MRAALSGESVSACRRVAVAVVCILVASASAAAQSVTVDQAIRTLTEEAKLLAEPVSARDGQTTTDRPHLAVADLPVSALPEVIERIDDRFTGDVYADAYVRYHLLWLLEQELERAFEAFRRSGEFEPAAGVNKALAKLVADAPDVPGSDHEPEKTPEVARLDDQINDLRAATEVVVGVPGAQVSYFLEDALPYVGKSRQNEIRNAIRQRDQLVEQRRRLGGGVDRDAQRRNSLRRTRSRMIRHYRNHLIYAAVHGGDPAMLRKAVDAMADLVSDHQRVGYDLLGWIYVASFNGSLSLYDERTLSDVRRTLDRAARANDSYVEIQDGGGAVNWYVRPRFRNFADASFHLRQLLESPDILRVLLERSPVREQTPPPKPQTPVTPSSLTLEDVEGASARAVRALLNPPDIELRVEGRRSPVAASVNLAPHYRPRSDEELWDMAHRQEDSLEWVDQGQVHEIGEHAAIAWALLQAGHSYQDPELFRRINWVFASDTERVYDRAMRVLMASQLSADRWGAYLRRDVDWLLKAMTTKGSFTDVFRGERSDDWGDHANAQYAVLALAAAADAGVDVPGEAWELIDKHWRLSQGEADDGAAGWALLMLGKAAEAQQQEEQKKDEEDRQQNRRSQLSARPTVPMTAGGVATLITTERLLGQADTGFSSDLQRGLAWLDQHFTVQQDPGNELDWYFYMWTIQRVGQASGYARFNSIDWFREVTARMINQQDPDGFWPARDDMARQIGANTLKVGPGPSTAFALLYLGAALDPVGISKVRYQGKWNERPTDIWNFVDYASDQYEWDTTWRIIDAAQPVHELIESPLLYLSVGDRFALSDAEAAGLRDYVLAGGTLLVNPDRAAGDINASISRLVEQLFPGRSLQDIATDDPIYDLHRDVRPSVQMKAIHNGVRPMLITFVRDIGDDLQDNNRITSDAFATLSNLYLHVVGKNARRSRLQTNYISEPTTAARRTVRAARVQYEGVFDPEPAALTQLGRLLQRDHGVGLDVQTLEPAELDGQVKIAFLTTTGAGSLSEAQAQQLRQWVEQGGTLWIDAAGGSKDAADAAFTMLQQIAPQQPPMPLRPTHPVLTGEGLPGGEDNRTVKYRRYALQRMTPTNRPRLQAVDVGGRPGIIFSPEDLTAGWAGLEHWGIFGYDVPSARQIGVNAVLDAID